MLEINIFEKTILFSAVYKLEFSIVFPAAVKGRLVLIINNNVGMRLAHYHLAKCSIGWLVLYMKLALSYCEWARELGSAKAPVGEGKCNKLRSSLQIVSTVNGEKLRPLYTRKWEYLVKAKLHRKLKIRCDWIFHLIVCTSFSFLLGIHE